MKLYTAKVRLSGSLLNEVIKHNLTPAEIVLLRALHGDDAVVDIEHVADVNRSDRKERLRLAGMYSLNSPKGVQSGEDLVREFLGIDSQPLPKEVEVRPVAATASEDVDEDDEDEIVVPLNGATVEPIKRRRVARNVDPLEELTA